MEDGARLLLNKRAYLQGETLPPGQARIGNSGFDVYYWNPIAAQLKATPNLRTVRNLSGGGSKHMIIPEGASVLGPDSGERTVPVRTARRPATASQIDYLTRPMLERLAPVPK